MSLDQPIPVQHSVVKGVAKFDFTAERNDELTLKVCVLEVEFCQNCLHCYKKQFSDKPALSTCRLATSSQRWSPWMRSGLWELWTGNVGLFRKIMFQSFDGDSADHEWTLN